MSKLWVKLLEVQRKYGRDIEGAWREQCLLLGQATKEELKEAWDESTQRLRPRLRLQEAILKQCEARFPEELLDETENGRKEW